MHNARPSRLRGNQKVVDKTVAPGLSNPGYSGNQLNAVMVSHPYSAGTTASAQRHVQADPVVQWDWAMDENLRLTHTSITEYSSAHDPEWYRGKTITEVFVDSYGVESIADIQSTDFDHVGFQNHLETLQRHEPFNNFITRRLYKDEVRWQSVSGNPQFDPQNPSRFIGYTGTAIDITNLREHLNHASLLSQALENSTSGLAVVSASDHLVHCNQTFRDLLGLEMSKSMLGTTLTSLLSDFDSAHQKILFKRFGKDWLLRSLEQCNQSFAMGEWSLPNNTWIQIKTSRTSAGTLTFNIDDITAHKKSRMAFEAERNLLQSMLNAIPDTIFARDRDLKYLALNEATARMFGMENTRECIGKVTIAENIDAEKQKELMEEEREIIKTGKPVLKKIVSDDWSTPGNKRTEFLNKVPLKDHEGKVIGLLGYSRDQTDILNLTEQLAYQAEHDALTGLINRRGFDQRVENAIECFTDTKTPSVVCFADLDQFKIVNDTVGHKAGDELLKQVTQLISRRIRRDDVFARLGGDEFGMIFRNCKAGQVLPRIHSIIEDISSYRFKWEDKLFEIGASIGVVELGEESDSVEGVCSRADMACYTAKDLGRSRYHVFSNTDHESTQRQNEIERAADIRAALDENRFELHMQPIAKTGPAELTIHHYEALVRMIDKDGNIVSPGIFIPAAERFKLMGAVDQWVINKALSSYKEVFGENSDTILTINLSGNSLNDPALVAYVKSCINQYGIDPGTLCFEITETAFISKLSTAQSFIAELGDFGCEFALDDFGSGLSSFAYLKNFKIDYLKIDGGFVRNMVEDSIDRAMVSAIHNVGKTMGIMTIAEFVESEKHIELLKEIGVDYVQGYAIGKPQPMLSTPA